MRAWLADQGRDPRTVLIPDTAHGTNPASVVMAGYEPRQLPSDARGGVDLEALRAAVGDDIACLMLTNPNTLGVFDENIAEIAAHRARRRAACSTTTAPTPTPCSAARGPATWASTSSTSTRTRPSRRRTAAAGPAPARSSCATSSSRTCRRRSCVRRDDGVFGLDDDRPQSIGRVRSFLGNFLVLVRAYAYIRSLGADGLAEVSDAAVLNANYVLAGVRDLYELPYDRRCMHEFVVSAEPLREYGVRALDVAKRLLDAGVHPPTTYFPLIVKEALMIEPTETESKDDLDGLVAALRAAADDARRDPEALLAAPLTMPVRRLDEVAAARNPVVRQPRDGDA